MFNQANRLPARMSRLAAFIATASSLCLPATGLTAFGADPVPPPGFTGVSLRVLNSTIPPGGMFQFQLALTEPKPIGLGSTRPALPTGTPTGISLNDPIGQTAGVAIINSSGIQINFNSPLATFGTNPVVDYPIITVSMPISPNAPVGQQFPLSINLADSFWLDPFGQPYPQEIAPGRLTIGGSLAISNVAPGSGVQPAGARISIFGVGFLSTSQVNIEGTNLAVSDWQVISPNQIDVILPNAVQMEGNRVRVKNVTETSTYFSYLHATPVGQSTHALLAQTYPLFARQRYTSATLPWANAGSQFTGLALQNPEADVVQVTLEMTSSAGNVLGTFSFPLPGLSKINRDISEFFAQPPPGTAAIRITSSSPIQMLGLLGDDATGDVVPVILNAL
jgi:hypothetical protein